MPTTTAQLMIDMKARKQHALRIPLLFATALALSITLTGWREGPEPIGVGPHPAYPQVTVPPASYLSVMDGMRDYEIVQPKPWGSVNEEVAPKKE